MNGKAKLIIMVQTSSKTDIKMKNKLSESALSKKLSTISITTYTINQCI